MRNVLLLLIVGFTASVLVGVAAGAEPSTREIHRSKAKVTAGGTLRLRNLNGPVTVKRGAGTEVEVVAVARWRNGDPAAIKVERREGAGGVTYCVLWPAKTTRCEADGTYEHAQPQSNSDVSVSLEVVLPAGVALDAQTQNGAIAAQGGGDVKLQTMNGAIEVDAGAGAVEAETMNGAITLRVADGKGGVRAETMNGAILVRAAKGASASLDLATTNGRVEVDGQAHGRAWSGQIGKGGRTVQAHTHNGAVRFERR